ncbi:hypothetical protein [Chromobacterium sp. Panama]|uniref:hypothetical protein n=1 Tax=Chromobacterium sp. Panama TaxID=2161826 RepID=UPI0011B22AD0|nr:hypothetical protein [Chromobacterium sp. Panama]
MTKLNHICAGEVVTTPQGRLADIDACLVPEIASSGPWAASGHLKAAATMAALPATLLFQKSTSKQMRELEYADDEGHFGCFHPKAKVHSKSNVVRREPNENRS